MTIFVGKSDARATVAVAEGWNSVSSKSVSIIEINGGHFMVQENEEVQKIISKSLEKKSLFSYFCS